MADRGEAVIAVARRVDVLDELVSEAGPSVTAIGADVTTTAGVGAIVDATEAHPISSLVHCAGSLIPLQPWADLDQADLLSHFRVHVAAPITLTKALLARGPVVRIAFIDSYSATTPRVGWSAYAMVKAAAQMSARSASAELGGTAVARIFPGAVATPLLEQVLDGADDVPAVGVYRAFEEDGRVSDPLDVGRQITAILLDTSPEEFCSLEVWHVGHSA